MVLPPKLLHVHDVFDIAMLRKYKLDPYRVISFDDIKLKDDTTYIEKPLRDVVRKERKLRTKVIPIVNIIWRQVSESNIIGKNFKI